MKICLLPLLLLTAQAWALDVRPLKDGPAAVVEQLPPSTSAPSEKKSLLDHLSTSPSPPDLATPPTTLPPSSGKLPPLPPSLSAPSGKWADLPPLPDGTQFSVPDEPRPLRTTGSKAKSPARVAPAKPDYAKEFPQCVAEAQQYASRFPARLMRNDKQVYTVAVIENNQRKTITCSVTKGKTIE